MLEGALVRGCVGQGFGKVFPPEDQTFVIEKALGIFYQDYCFPCLSHEGTYLGSSSREPSGDHADKASEC